MTSVRDITRIAVTAAGAALLLCLAHTAVADSAIEAEIRQLVDSGHLSYPNIEISDPALIAQVYSRRDYAPAWDAATDLREILNVVRYSVQDGLRPDDYQLERLESTQASIEAGRRLTNRGRAALDIVLTDALARLTHDLRFGKMLPAALPPRFADPASNREVELLRLLERLISAAELASEVNAALPRSRHYLRLRAALNQYRLIRERGGWPVLAAGSTIRPGDRDKRLDDVVQRLAATGDLVAASRSFARYGVTLEAAVRRFQERHGLPEDGTIGPATLRAMNVTVDERIAQLRVNLERARWAADISAAEVVRVNIPAYRAELIRDGSVVAKTRVIVGQADTGTPEFCSEIRYIVLNPSWTVPHSIASEELLGIIQADPGFLQRGGYDVINRNGEAINAADIDWEALDTTDFPYTLVQRPGPQNELGQLKFAFPNAFSIYMHDTSARALFDRTGRALSHGCIRVDQPVDLAAELLQGEGWTRRAIEAQIDSGVTRTLFLSTPIPVVISYLTAEVDQEGVVFFYPDIYDRDAAVLAALDAESRERGTLN